MILVDANIWVYFLDASSKEHARVKTALPRLLGDDELLMPTVVQMEVIHYVARRLGAGAHEVVHTFLTQAGTVEPLTGGLVAEASRLLLAHLATGIGGRDAAILATAKLHGATLLTHDQDLARAAQAMGLRVADPVGTAAP